MRWALATLFLAITSPVAARDKEVITVSWRAGFMPVPVSERWRLSTTGRLEFIRITGPARATIERPQVTRKRVTLSPKEHQQLKTVLEAIRRHKGSGPCTAPDGPGFTMQFVTVRKSWAWSSDNGCKPGSALRMMNAAFEARSLLERVDGVARALRGSTSASVHRRVHPRLMSAIHPLRTTELNATTVNREVGDPRVAAGRDPRVSGNPSRVGSGRRDFLCVECHRCVGSIAYHPGRSRGRCKQPRR